MHLVSSPGALQAGLRLGSPSSHNVMWQPGSCNLPMCVSWPLSEYLHTSAVCVRAPCRMHAGTLPPFAHATEGIPVLIDTQCMAAASTEAAADGSAISDPQQQRPSLLYTGSGSASSVVALTPSQLLMLSKGSVSDLAQGSPQGLALTGPTSIVQASQAASSISIGSTGAQPAGFLCDGMLGRLCRWLRCLGVDAELVRGDAGVKISRAQMAAIASQVGAAACCACVHAVMN